MKKLLTLLLAGMMVLSMAACTSTGETNENQEESRDVTTQVVVVGAGGAGMAAAIEATDQGLDVILIEKLAMVGGTTTMASTAYNAGGMKLQLEADPPYTADDAYAAWIGSGEDDPFIRLLSDRSGATGDWLVEMGADLGKFNGKQVMTSDGSALGPMLTATLSAAVSERGIDLRTETAGKKLVTDEAGKVVGIEVEDG